MNIIIKSQLVPIISSDNSSSLPYIAIFRIMVCIIRNTHWLVVLHGLVDASLVQSFHHSINSNTGVNAHHVNNMVVSNH